MSTDRLHSQGTGATKPSRPLAFSTPMGVSVVAVLAVVLIGALVLLDPRGLFGVGLDPSPSPEPATPSAAPADATTTPEATPSAGAPEPTVLPAGVTYDTNDPFAAIVLVNDLRVREAPATGSVLGALDAGDTIVIGIDETVDGMAWYRVTADGLFGWVAAGPEDDPWLDLRYRVAAQVPPRVEGIVGGDGFVAWGWSGSSGSDDGRRWVAFSEDGRDWQLGTIPDETHRADEILVAHGPAGWLMVASRIVWDENDNTTSTTRVDAWSSLGGLTWAPAPLPTDHVSSLSPATLVGSASGYVLGQPLLASRDLATWTPLDLPSTCEEPMVLGDGFLSWYDGHGVGRTRYTDLVDWVDVSEGEHAGIWACSGTSARAGERLVAITDTGPGHREVWAAAIPDWSAAPAAMRWELLPGSASAIDGSTVAEMLTVGEEALVLGNSYESGAFWAWHSADGSSWDAVDTSPLDGYAVGSSVAADGDVLVAVASEVTPAGWSPRFARWTAAEGWSIEAHPVLGTTESAVVGACPDVPDTALEWAAIPGAVGAECFGDQSITFAAWWPEEITSGGGSTWVLEPRWLRNHVPIQIIEANGAVAIASRSDKASVLGMRGSWVSLTGHWADAEASACRYRPDSTFPHHLIGSGYVGDCRSVFVLMEIAPAP